MRVRIASSVLGSVLALSAATPASAQSAMTPINKPVPRAFKARVEALIRELRPNDAGEAVHHVKTTGGSAGADFLSLRVEFGCQRSLCMTVVARVTETALVPEFVLAAGPWVYSADTPTRLWNDQAWPMAFQGEGKSTIVVLLFGGRWIFSACDGCAPSFPETDAVTAPEPDEPPPGEVDRRLYPPTFEEFRRSLGRPE